MFVICAFAGLQMLLGMLAGPLLFKMGVRPELGNPESFADLFENPWFLSTLVGATALSHFAGGFLAGKSSAYVPGLTYTYAVLASFLTSLILTVFLLVNVTLRVGWPGLSFLADPALALWLVYIYLALLGSRLAVRSRIQSPSSDQPTRQAPEPVG
ncbi:MAG TPA: hypothetical protein VGC93_11130 [Thermoanaerobaculia bacterium]